MATDPDKLAQAMSSLVEFLQAKMPDPELDDISVMLDGGVDVTGNPTAAMDRRARRQMAAGRIAADKKASTRTDYAERFPNAARLGHGL